MKTYHLIQLRHPARGRFCDPIAFEVEGGSEEAMKEAFRLYPTAAEAHYYKEITQEVYLTRVSAAYRPS